MKAMFALLLAASLLPAFSQTGGQDADEKAAIRQAALDYIEGWFTGDAERMEGVLHPGLAKRSVIRIQDQEKFIHLNKTQMVDATRDGGGRAVPEDRRAIKIDVLDVYRDMATARVESVSFIEYLHLAKSEGKWKVVNVLWKNNFREPKEVPVDPRILSSYAGEYELQPGYSLVVTLEDKQLFVQVPGEQKMAIYPESEKDFFFKVMAAQITFVVGDGGQATGLIVRQGGADMPAKKIK